MTKEIKAYSIEHVYLNGNEIIITGCAEDEDENHNCDYAGCGQECVLFRGWLNSKEIYTTLYDRKEEREKEENLLESIEYAKDIGCVQYLDR